MAELSARFQEICSDMGLEALEAADVRRRDYDMQRIRDYIEKIDQKYENAVSVKKDLQTVIQENEDALVQVRNIESIDLNLDDLFECRYIKIRFGRLPLDSVKKLQYYRNRPLCSSHSARMILTAGVCI